jgi:hypothetical protein
MLEQLQKSSAKTIKIEINIKKKKKKKKRRADERIKGQVKIWKSGQKALTSRITEKRLSLFAERPSTLI